MNTSTRGSALLQPLGHGRLAARLGLHWVARGGRSSFCVLSSFGLWRREVESVICVSTDRLTVAVGERFRLGKPDRPTAARSAATQIWRSGHPTDRPALHGALPSVPTRVARPTERDRARCVGLGSSSLSKLETGVAGDCGSVRPSQVAQPSPPTQLLPFKACTRLRE